MKNNNKNKNNNKKSLRIGHTNCNGKYKSSKVKKNGSGPDSINEAEFSDWMVSSKLTFYDRKRWNVTINGGRMICNSSAALLLLVHSKSSASFGQTIKRCTFSVLCQKIICS